MLCFALKMDPSTSGHPILTARPSQQKKSFQKPFPRSVAALRRAPRSRARFPVLKPSVASMCVAFIALAPAGASTTSQTDAANENPTRSITLLVAFNRDEDYSRPTTPLHAWRSSEDAGEVGSTCDIVGARDTLGGGTWMAMCRRTGRWALLTNAHGTWTSSSSASPVKRGRERTYVTRGELVTNYLRRDVDGGAYTMEVFAKRFNYDGFNLVVGDASNPGIAHYVGNRGLANQNTPMRLVPGKVYGLANDILDAPWPKVVRGKAKLEEILSELSGLTERRAVEERVLRDVLHAPLDAVLKPTANTFNTDGRAGVRVSSPNQTIADRDWNGDPIDVDVSDDDEEDQEFTVEQIEPHESDCSFVRPGELPGRPNCGTRTSQVIVVSADGRCTWREHHFSPKKVSRRTISPRIADTVVAHDRSTFEFTLTRPRAASSCA